MSQDEKIWTRTVAMWKRETEHRSTELRRSRGEYPAPLNRPASETTTETAAGIDEPKLLGFEFVGLAVISFLAMCNIALFYNFQPYMAAIGIAIQQTGVLIGAFSFTAMILIPIVSPRLHAHNAVSVMFAGVAIIAVSLWSYPLITDFVGLLALRVCHGVGFILYLTAAVAYIVNVIPDNRSAEAFGYFSTGTLLPFMVVPAAMEFINPLLPSPAQGYAYSSILLIPALPILFGLRAHTRMRMARGDAAPERPSPLTQLKLNLSRADVALLLGINAVFFVSLSTLFYFVAGYATRFGVSNIGGFFTLQYVAIIGVRLVGARLFDRADRIVVASASVGVLIGGFITLALMRSGWELYLAAVLIGLGMGVGVPMFNSLMFSISRPEYRGLNTNLMMTTLQAGYFFGPIIGASVIAGFSYTDMFVGGALLNLVVILLLLLLKRIAPSTR